MATPSATLSVSAGDDSQALRRARRAKRRGRSGAPKLSRLRPPDHMSLEAWQTELRRQFGPGQEFSLENIGDQPVFSEFRLTNPKTQGTYRVAIRGTGPGENYCSCPDFATNSLGTCKHIEFTLAKLRRQRGGRSALAHGFQPPYSEAYLAYGGEREVRFRPGTECPRDLARLASEYFDVEGRLRPAAFGHFESFVSKAAALDSSLRVYEDVLGFVAEVRDAERRADRVAEAFPRGIHSAAFKRLIRLPLYDYQREGVLFAARAGRCLIGDEMGLGKTMQAIAATEVMARLFGVERVLVICPTSLKHQWQREIARSVDRSVEVIGGQRQRRQERFAAESFYKIINYDTAHADLDLIETWGPDLVIIDEAQRIKNWNTRTARSVKKISSPYAIVLTGTPLENRLEELVSIVEFIDRHRLGPTFRFLHDHQERDPETGRVVGYRDLDRIGKTLQPILLRRRKAEVLTQLPERLEKHFFVPMTPEQMAHHDENREIVARVVAKWRRYGFLSEADQRRLMIALQNMRMSCNSTYLLDHQTDFGSKADELATLLDEIYEQPDAKVVVFSQWVRTHELILRRFERRRWDHVFFHGGVDSNGRKALIDRFREDRTCRAFLSTDAGGVGLNLQHASAVLNMDLPWNPAVLEQRIGRVHRLGQTRRVQVVNFVAQGTIEEGMLSVLRFKKSLFAGVLDGGEKQVFLGGSRLTRFLETVEKVTGQIPEAVAEDRPASDSADRAAETALAAADAAPPAFPIVAPPSCEAALAADPLDGLIELGRSFLEQLAAAAHASSSAPPADGARPLRQRVIELARDDRTGTPYLKLPLPSAEVLEQALGVVRSLVLGLRT